MLFGLLRRGNWFSEGNMSQKEKLIKKYIKLLQIEIKREKHFSEYSHEYIDALLCELLKEIGYEKVVNVYNSILKWYS